MRKETSRIQPQEENQTGKNIQKDQEWDGGGGRVILTETLN